MSNSASFNNLEARREALRANEKVSASLYVRENMRIASISFIMGDYKDTIEKAPGVLREGLLHEVAETGDYAAQDVLHALANSVERLGQPEQASKGAFILAYGYAKPFILARNIDEELAVMNLVKEVFNGSQNGPDLDSFIERSLGEKCHQPVRFDVSPRPPRSNPHQTNSPTVPQVP